MNYPKAIIVNGALAVLVVGAAGFFAAHANIAYADDCGVTADQIAQIAAIQNNPTLTYMQEIQQELALRRQLVGQTVACAEQDVQTYQTALQAVTVDSGDQTLQSQLLAELNEATDFYNNELVKLNQGGIAESKIVAKEVLNWRQSSFFPLTEQINNFILWTQNQPLFATAQTRMDQTTRAVDFLESASPNADLQDAFNSSTAAFSLAQSQNAAAETALEQDLSADQSVTLIKDSLESLSSTYQGFATISGIINTMLPQ